MTLQVFGFEEFLFSILSIGITSIVMTYIETGLRRKKAVMAISMNHANEIRNELLTHVNRGLTLFDTKGGVDRTEREMIMIIAGNQEYPMIKNIIKKIDPECFFITYNVSEVQGLGFTYHPIQ